MSDDETVQGIVRFKRALDDPSDASDSEEEYIGTAYTNRGNKLKRNARNVYHGRLNKPPYDGFGLKIVDYGDGKRRAVVSSKPKHGDGDETGTDIADADADADADDDDDDGYNEIKLGDLLAPISNPAELPGHPAIARTYKSPALHSLSTRAMDIINQEHKNVVQFSQLMRLFLGEDPAYSLPKNLNLPVYDHLNVMNGQNVPAKEAQVKEPVEDDRPRTRNQSIQEVDPFFAPPQFMVDPDFGLSREAAEETRQFVQIALQRSEEFIRCMTKVRMGLLRADRLKNQVYKWCKDMAIVENEEAAVTAAAATEDQLQQPPKQQPKPLQRQQQ